MSAPLVTIGIPTYNRAIQFLKDSLTSALAQSYPHLEIVVSDNASTDNTSQVVETLGHGRVKYFRHATNLGATANFKNVLDQATGEYFAWLQDDDAIFPEFIANAVRALQQHPTAVAYCAYALQISNPAMLNQPTVLFGPPLPLNWVASEPIVVSGNFITPASMFLSVAIPPVILFRRSELTEPIVGVFFDKRFLLYTERNFLARLALDRQIILAPRVAGVFRMHPGNAHSAMHKSTDEWRAQRISAGDDLNELWGSRDVDQCPEFQRVLVSMPDEQLQFLLIDPTSLIDRLTPNRLSLQVKLSIERELARRTPPPPRLTGFKRLRRQAGVVAQEIMPPILFRGVRQAIHGMLGSNQ